MIAERAWWIFQAIERELMSEEEKTQLEAAEEVFKATPDALPSATASWLEDIFTIVLWRGWEEGIPQE